MRSNGFGNFLVKKLKKRFRRNAGITKNIGKIIKPKLLNSGKLNTSRFLKSNIPTGKIKTVIKRKIKNFCQILKSLNILYSPQIFAKKYAKKNALQNKTNVPIFSNLSSDILEIIHNNLITAISRKDFIVKHSPENVVLKIG